jgi:hypothetical protein
MTMFIAPPEGMLLTPEGGDVVRTSNWLAWTVLAALSVGWITGCTPVASDRMQRQSIDPRYESRGIDIDGDGDRAWLSGNNNINNPPVKLTQMAPMAGGYADLTQGPYPGWATAERVSDLARIVPGVAGASTVLRGQTAIVGLSLDRNVSQEQAGKIQQQVRQLLLAQAPVFRSVHITADEVLSRRVSDMAQAVRNGRPVSQMNREMDQLVRDIPETPPH